MPEPFGTREVMLDSVGLLMKGAMELYHMRP